MYNTSIKRSISEKEVIQQRKFSQNKKEVTQIDIDKYLCQPLELSIKTPVYKMKENISEEDISNLNSIDSIYELNEQGEPIQNGEKIEFKVINRDEDGVPSYKDISMLSDTYNKQNGLLSLLYEVKERGSRIKLIICVTAYDEGNDKLELTMKGIQSNMHYFKKQGIQPCEILVIVMFDGIDKINNNNEQKDENIFYQTFAPYDLFYQIDEKQSMQYQLNKYKEAFQWSEMTVEKLNENKKLQEQFKKELDNDQTDINLTLLQEFEESLLKQMKKQNMQIEKYQYVIDKFIKEFKEQVERKKVDTNYTEFTKVLKTNILIKYLKDLQSNPEMFDILKKTFAKCLKNSSQRHYSSQDDYVNEKRKIFIQNVREEGEKYIKDRHNSAWVYQERILIQSSEERQELGADLNYDFGEDTSDEEENNQKNFNTQESQLSVQSSANNKSDRASIKININNKNEQQKTGVKNSILNDLKENYLNVIYVAKFRNAKKLDSHLWFFKGFCEFLNPTYTVMIDIGLEPKGDSIYKFFECLELNKYCGGVCGFMGLRPERIIDDEGKRLDQLDGRVDFISRLFHNFFNIQKAQAFEFDIEHIVDKAFQSLFGYVHVLPGAFCAYKYDAIKDVLGDYLKTELNPDYIYHSLQEANMYLKEDRILSMELYCSKNYTMQYVPESVGYVDPITNLPHLMGQRRRWINGGWFSLNYVLANYSAKVSKSSHSWFNKFLLFLSMAYSQLSKLAQFFSLAIQFTILLMIYDKLLGDSSMPRPATFQDSKFEFSQVKYISLAMFVYFINVGGMTYFSLNYKQNSKQAYGIWYAFSTMYGIFMLISFGFLISQIVNSLFFNDTNQIQDFTQDEKSLLKLMIIVTLGSMMAPVFFDSLFKIKSGGFFEKYYNLAANIISFTFYLPTYIQMFQIYAFCNIDDLQWGTKTQTYHRELNKFLQAKIKQRKEEFAEDKFYFVAKWFFLNIMLGCTLGYLSRDSLSKKIMIGGIAVFISIFLILKCAGASLFYLKQCSRFLMNCLSGKAQLIKQFYIDDANHLNKILSQITDKMYMDRQQPNSLINHEIELQQILQKQRQDELDKQQILQVQLRQRNRKRTLLSQSGVNQGQKSKFQKQKSAIINYQVNQDDKETNIGNGESVKISFQGNSLNEQNNEFNDQNDSNEEKKRQLGQNQENKNSYDNLDTQCIQIKSNSQKGRNQSPYKDIYESMDYCNLQGNYSKNKNNDKNIKGSNKYADYFQDGDNQQDIEQKNNDQPRVLASRKQYFKQPSLVLNDQNDTPQKSGKKNNSSNQISSMGNLNTNVSENNNDSYNQLCANKQIVFGRNSTLFPEFRKESGGQQISKILEQKHSINYLSLDNEKQSNFSQNQNFSDKGHKIQSNNDQVKKIKVQDSDQQQNNRGDQNENIYKHFALKPEEIKNLQQKANSNQNSFQKLITQRSLESEYTNSQNQNSRNQSPVQIRQSTIPRKKTENQSSSQNLHARMLLEEQFNRVNEKNKNPNNFYDYGGRTRSRTKSYNSVNSKNSENSRNSENQRNQRNGSLASNSKRQMLCADEISSKSLNNSARTENSNYSNNRNIKNQNTASDDNQNYSQRNQQNNNIQIQNQEGQNVNENCDNRQYNKSNSIGNLGENEKNNNNNNNNKNNNNNVIKIMKKQRRSYKRPTKTFNLVADDTIFSKGENLEDIGTSESVKNEQDVGIQVSKNKSKFFQN